LLNLGSPGAALCFAIVDDQARRHAARPASITPFMELTAGSLSWSIRAGIRIQDTDNLSKQSKSK